ncbi:dynein regulatory complex protein 1 [Athalia rosae]|uniref:dynein regulatory complex protein 1 n=1 Tax=Athalia rosae TaxID=37344 RepID=UPI002033985C|nr:dynein regulatory complex protein 1 [Athalia rosae]XP_048510183.1 dynein regulatory complex protein 1 [Athalia rosae]
MDTNGNKPQEDVDDPEEPSITSSDPNERKLARRLRMQRRLEALKRQEGLEEEVIIEKSTFEKQIDASADLLEKLISEGEEAILNVRIANDAREVHRRNEESQVRRKLLAQLEEEAKESMEKYHEINAKWTNILASKDPLDIHCEMKAQNTKCLEILKEKDQLISDLKHVLEDTDLKFATDQQKQNDDINLLMERIDNQINTISTAYRRELVLIDKAIESERKVLLISNAKKWEQLYKQRNQNEIDGFEARKQIMRDYDIEMKRVMTEHQEEYRAQKIWFETEYQKLQQELQQMKSTCLMNIEKLDYSYSVLKRREDENTIIKNQQKRRINKLQDVVNGLKKTYVELEENTRLEIQKLSEQVIKTHKSILELEQKSNHFTAINEKQYKKIWNMNANSVGDLANKILTVDQIIYENTLGLEWEPPEKPLLAMEDLPSYQEVMNQMDRKKSKARETIEICKPYVVATTLTEVNAERQLLYTILNQISDHTGFLIEDRLRELLTPYTVDEKHIIRLNNIFQALSIKSETEIRMMMTFFLPYSYCPICTHIPLTCGESSETLATEALDESDEHSLKGKADKKQTSFGLHEETNQSEGLLPTLKSSETTGSKTQCYCVIPDDADLGVEDTSLQKKSVVCEKGHALFIESAYVTRAFREFITKYHAAQHDEIPMTFKEKLNYQELTVSRNLAVEDVTEFWKRYREIFSTKKEKLWDGLLIGLRKYHEVLKERHKLNTETSNLQRQNSELRRLLQIYMLKPAQGSCLPPLELRSNSSIE